MKDLRINYTDALLGQLSEIAPDGFMIGLHLQNSRPRQYFATYPPAWLNYYSENNLILFDPLIACGLTSTGAEEWSEIGRIYPDPLQVMSKAADHGLTYGIGISIAGTTSRTLAGFANGKRKFLASEVTAIHDIVRAMHCATDREFILTQAQKDALHMLGSGQTYDQACENLRISRTALRLRLQRARSIFGVETNHEAVRMARDAGLIPSTSNRETSGVISFPPLPLAK